MAVIKIGVFDETDSALPNCFINFNIKMLPSDRFLKKQSNQNTSLSLHFVRWDVFVNFNADINRKWPYKRGRSLTYYN